MKKIFKFILPIITLSSALTTTSLTGCSCNSTHLRLTRDDWEDQTKTALNQCIANYGVDGQYYSKDNYVVFDFDNTTAIFDIQHQCTTYQIERMAYNLTKDQLFDVLATGLNNIEIKLTDKGFDFSYKDLIDDIVASYGNLETKYGPFSYQGVDENKLDDLHKENDWKDFSAKLRSLYNVVAKVQGDKERGKWSTYQFTNMTPQQVYDLEYKCLEYYTNIDTHYETWTSITPIHGTEEVATIQFASGVSVSENIKELYKTIKDNGIDIWIISASQIDQVRAAADVYGLGQYVSGCFALTNKLGDDGKYISAYDTYGKGYIRDNNQWAKMDKPNTNYTSGIGKSLTIRDMIAPNYNNKGPIMCFGDSTGDFNFCTEFKDTKLVVCFNRADRSVADGGGLMAVIAIYQKINSMTLEKANANNDTLYCLQGRDDNGKRSFRNSNKTIKLDYTYEELFYNRANYDLLNYITYNNLTIAQACQLCLKQEVEGIQVGFLTTYDGYHSR